MKFRTSAGKWRLLALAAGLVMLSATALAQSPPAVEQADKVDEEAAPAPDKKDEDILKDVDIDKLDWSQLDIDASMLDLPSVKARAAAKRAENDDTKWSSSAKGNGVSDVSVKQSISPF